ncbi:MAG: hypothetical protein ACREQ5_16210, partial [Candidatus Dormibacteria bacterium]
APTQGPNAPTGVPGGSQGGVGGVMGQLGSTIGNAVGITDPTAQGSIAPAMLAAGDLYHNAGQYTNIANQAAGMANPFGQYRNQYGQELSNLEQNPSAIAQTPGYQFAMNQALDNAGSRLRSQGYLGSSQMSKGLTNEASGMAQQTYNNTIAQLSNLAGAQFNPSSAAELLSSGMTNAANARSQAVSDMFAPFGMQNMSRMMNPGSYNPNGSANNTQSPSAGNYAQVVNGAGQVVNGLLNSGNQQQGSSTTNANADMTGFNTDPWSTPSNSTDPSSTNGYDFTQLGGDPYQQFTDPTSINFGGG